MKKWLVVLAVALAVTARPGSASPQGGGRDAGKPVRLALFGWGGDKSENRSPMDREEAERARSMLGSLEGEARLVFFGKEDGCRQCAKVKALLGELTSITPSLSLDAGSLETDGDRAAGLGIDRAPAIAVLGPGGKDTGIRYYGLPLGFEFEAFLQALVWAARGEHGLARETVEGLDRLDREVTIGVFVARH